MTVDVERVYDVDVPIEEVWTRLSDPAFRAQTISVVDGFDVEGDEIIWWLYLPIPGFRRTISVRTRDIERDPPRYVKFVGDAGIMSVQGEHELTATDAGCRIRNTFRVDGSIPGIERFFSRRIDDEIDGMIRALGEDVTVHRVR